MAHQITGPIVTTQEGKLRGTFGKNLDGEDFLQFFGIPYAKPPLGDLRFKPPQPADSWNGVKDATKVGNASISRDFITSQIEGSEDCLYLNVYTKNLSNEKPSLRPVMVFIHGGGLTMGSSSPETYGPEFLLTKDIVLVSLNYRLGLLGFLALDDPALGVTGNMGLKDQTLALKWVQRNIANFNGDPNNVTIFGESAGAGSVHAHILSQASKGLFHKAILQSGSTFNSWFWGSKNNVKEIVKQLGKSVSSEKEALEILKGLSGTEIFSAQAKMGDTFYPSVRRHFSAVIETPNDAAFLSKSPLEIIKEGSYNKVPIIIGYTKTEGILLELVKSWAASVGGKTPDFQLDNMIPHELNIREGSHDRDKIIQILDKLYSSSADTYDYDAYTDTYFLVGMTEAIRNHLKTSVKPIYFYRMSLEGQLNYLKAAVKMLDKPGTGHADDLGYLFHMEQAPVIKPESLEDKSVRTFVELWTNFAEFGNPTPDSKLNVVWRPVENEENIKLLDIGEELVFTEIPEQNRLGVWWDILKKWPLNRFN